MELSFVYIVSQLFVLASYCMLGITYFIKSRKSILVYNFVSLALGAVAFIFLQAWTGFAMIGVAAIRNAVFMLDEKKNGKRTNITKTDTAILACILLLIVGLSIVFYNGFLSLLSVFGTLIYTFAVWQKNNFVYRMLGIPCEALWLAYGVFIGSLLSIVFESLLLIVIIYSVYKHFKQRSQNQTKTTV